VVESPRPVHGNVRLLPVQLHSPSCPKRPGQGRGVQVCCRAHPLTALHLLAELGHVVWPYGSEELDVVVTVVFGHLICGGFHMKTYIDLHFSVEAIVQEEVVSHADPMWLHGVSLSIIVWSTILKFRAGRLRVSYRFGHFSSADSPCPHLRAVGTKALAFSPQHLQSNWRLFIQSGNLG
uniref:Uncharacterized protein n=1 Tax=Oryzias latipes TaxID=8090 RepID=A0A3P9MCC3_ORYLA